MAEQSADLTADPADGEAVSSGMDDIELVSLLQAHESRAVGYYDNEIASEQAKAINYYYGRMDDLPAEEGCSSVVDYSVAVMVDNALAAVLKPFVSAEEVVSFEPRGPEDVQLAEQATEYVNYVLNVDNPGFVILHHWFKDALLTKLGVVKVWWEDRSKRVPYKSTVNAEQLMQLRQDQGYQGEQDNGDGTFSVSHTKLDEDGRVIIENVPPEEFLITPYARSLEDAAYLAHRPNNYTRSDLIELGIDRGTVEGLPAFSDQDTQEQRRAARYRDETWDNKGRESNTNDSSRDVIAVLDEYVRVDYNGDGLAELRRVVRVNDQILFNEEVEDHPFATLCPVPMPHKVYGLSTADQAIEGQRINTVLKRETLDNLYKSNNPRPVLNETAMTLDTMDDLAETAPGAAIRVKTAGAIDWMMVPFTAAHSMPMLEATSRETEERTGFQRVGQGFNADALKKNSPDTATQASIDENARNERAEMIARIFAETGVRRLFKLVLKMLVNHQPKARVVRLRNQWVPMDPSGWDAEMDVSISVGLGVGNKGEQIAQADAVLQTIAELQGTPYSYLIDASKVYNALKRKFTATGIKNVDDFLVDPAQTEPPQPQPSPEAQKAQAETAMKAQDQQFKQAESAAKLQAQREESSAKIQFMREEAAASLQLAREKAAAEIALAREKAIAEGELARERMQMQAALDMHSTEAQMSQNRAGGDLDK